MSILDENIEPKFEDLLEGINWIKVYRSDAVSYEYESIDCEGRDFSIEFFPKGYKFEVTRYYDGIKTKIKKLRKDAWRVSYQINLNTAKEPNWTTKYYLFQASREDVITLMKNMSDREFDPKKYKVIKEMKLKS